MIGAVWSDQQQPEVGSTAAGGFDRHDRLPRSELNQAVRRTRSGARQERSARIAQGAAKGDRSMSKLKSIAVATAMLLCAAPASALAASGWMVNGAQLSGTATVKPIDPANYSEVTVPGVAVRCTAPAIDVEGGTISSPAGLQLPSVFFHGCKVTPAACELVENTIGTESLSASGITLEGPLAARGVLVAAHSFMTLEFEGTLCALSGTQIVIKGGVDFLAPEGQDERVSQPILWFSLPGQLKVGASEVHFHFQGSLLLESGKPWSFL
jgi:hypothetical protein